MRHNHDDHAQFAAARRRLYQEHPATVAHLRAKLGLDSQAARPCTPTVLVGEEGTGKSAFSAHIAAMAREHGGFFVVDLYAEAMAAGTAPLALVHEIADHIRRQYDVSRPVPRNPERLLESFPDWLARVQGRPMLLILDGLDHLVSRGTVPGSQDAGCAGHDDILDWLPSHFPPNVRLLVSARPGAIISELKDRQWEIVEIEPLDPDARRAFAIRHCAEIRPASGDELARILEGESIFGKPLVAGISVMEVQRLRSMHPERSVNEFLSEVRSLEDILDRVLVAMEEDYGAVELGRVLAPLAATRSGLAVEEIAALSLVDVSRVEEVLSWLELNLNRRGALVRCSGGTFLEVLTQRYLSDDAERRNLHIRIAEMLTSLPHGARRARELPWQWLQAGELDHLRDCISRLEMLHQMVANDLVYDLLDYWRALGWPLMADIYEREAMALVRKRNHTCNHADLLVSLATFLIATAELDTAERVLTSAIAILTTIFTGEHPTTLAAKARLASLLVERGEFERADPLVRGVLATQETLFGTAHPDTIDSLCDLGLLLFRRGEYPASEEYLKKARYALESKGKSNTSRYVMLLKLLAMPVRDLERDEEALDILKHAVAIAGRVMHPEHPEVALLKTELGTLQHMMGDHRAALELLNDAMRIRELLLGPSHLETGQSYNNLAHLYSTCPELDLGGKAEDYFSRAYRIHVAAYGADHHDCAVILHNHGKLLRDRGRREEALPKLRRALASFQASVGGNHRDTAICMGNLGELLCTGAFICDEYGIEAPAAITLPMTRERSAEVAEARTLLERAREIMINLFGTESMNTANALNRLSQLEFCSGRVQLAFEHADAALGIYRKQGLGERRQAGIALHRAARAQYWLGDHDCALALAMQAIRIFKADGVGGDPTAEAVQLLLNAVGGGEEMQGDRE